MLLRMNDANIILLKQDLWERFETIAYQATVFSTEIDNAPVWVMITRSPGIYSALAMV
jgi:hypothetical protein